MTGPAHSSLLHFDAEVFRSSFDRKPFGYTHDLHRLDLFSFDNLLKLAERYVPTQPDWFVAGSAPTPGTEFYSVDHGYLKPHEAMMRLEQGAHRVLLKRLENHDSAFRDLMDLLFKQIIELNGGLHGQKVVRRESAVFISSGAAITPFHFAPEINFFAQIEGEKRYHVYAPVAVSEPELERFFVRGMVDIAQIDLDGRDRSHEHVFPLVAGLGLHQPQNAPHWVETGASRSISYSIVWETDKTRADGRVRACNHYLRQAGLQPRPPGRGIDAAKAAAMSAVTPVRMATGNLLRSLRSR